MTPFSATAAAAECLDLVQSFDMAAAAARFAPDGVLEMPNRPGGAPTVLTGPEIRRFMDLLPRLFPRLKLGERVFHQTTTPTRAVVEYRGDGVSRTGRPYRNTYISVFEFDEQGRILLWREYFDSAVIAESLAPA